MPRSIQYRSGLARQHRVLQRRVADLETRLLTLQHTEARTVERRALQHDLLELQGSQLAAGARMAALIAHELNTPLQTIANYVYLLSDPTQLAPPATALAGIQHEVDRIAAVVQRLHTFQFADLADPTPVAVPAIIDRALLLLGNQAYRRNIRVERRFAAGLPRPVAYERRLTLVLLNLLRMIIVAAPAGSLLVLSAQVVAGSAAPAECLLQIAIEFERNGEANFVGSEAFAAEADLIDPEPFEPHALVALCHQLIAEQGGSLHLWDELGGRRRRCWRCRSNAGLTHSKHMTQQHVPARILLVEDDATARVSLTQVLERVGYIVEAVPDGETAVTRLRNPAWSRSLSVVMTDLLLRETDGITVLRYVRQLDDPPEVILLTGYGTLQTAIEALRSGAFDYLLKPCKPEELLNTVARAAQRCQKRRMEQAAVRTIAAGLAHLHRDGEPPPEAALQTQSVIPPLELRIGALQINRLTHLVTFAERVLTLTPTEYALILALAEARGAMVTYSALAQAAYGRVVDAYQAHQLLKTHIYNIRHKLDPRYIVNVRSAGYRLIDPAEGA